MTSGEIPTRHHIKENKAKYDTSSAKQVQYANNAQRVFNEYDGREHQRAVTPCLSSAPCFLLLPGIRLWLMWLSYGD